MGRLDFETETIIPVTGGFFDKPTHSLTQRYDSGEDGCGRGTPLVPVAFDCKSTDAQAGGVTPTMRAMNHSASHANAGGQLAVALQMNFIRKARVGDYAGSLSAQPRYAQFNGVWDKTLGVRRLTPVECERLQGFPDGYTAVQYRNKPAADGPRYKALGNSMAVPVMKWIGERIELVDSLHDSSGPPPTHPPRIGEQGAKQ